MSSTKKTLSISLFLFFVATLVSQSGMDGFATLSILSLIWYWFQSGRQWPLLPKLGIEKAFLSFAIAVVVSFLFNWDSTAYALKRIAELKWILNFYLLVSALSLITPRLKIFQRCQCILAFAATFALLTPILGYDILQGIDKVIDRTPSGVARVGGFFSDPMTFAHLHALYFFPLVGLTLKLFETKERDRLGSLAVTCLVGAALLFSYTRGVWLGMFVGFVVTGFIIHLRRGVQILLGSLAMIVAGFFLIPSVHERALQMLSGQSYDGERIWIWKANWQIFLDHPIFGIGYGQNAMALQSYYEKIGAPAGLIISHAHNQYLHLLAGLGLFGLSSYLSILFLMFRKTWKVYQSQTKRQAPSWVQGLLLGSLGAQVCFFIGGFTESNFEHSKVVYSLTLLWALAFWLNQEQFTNPNVVKNV